MRRTAHGADDAKLRRDVHSVFRAGRQSDDGGEHDTWFYRDDTHAAYDASSQNGSRHPLRSDAGCGQNVPYATSSPAPPARGSAL